MATMEDGFSGSRERLVAACDGMDRRLAALADAGDLATAIHESRKLGKKLRGGLRIAGAGKPLLRQLGLVGNLTGQSRDAQVRVGTWQLLRRGEAGEGSIEGLIDALVGHQAGLVSVRPPAAVVGWSRAAVGEARQWLESQPRGEFEDACRAGSGRLLRNLRKRLKRAAEKVEDADFHAARRATKFWLGGMKLLNPGRVREAAGVIEELGEVLGEEHDLAVFGDWLLEHGFSAATAPRVWKRLPKLQSRARRRSLALIRKEALPVLKALSRPAAEE